MPPVYAWLRASWDEYRVRWTVLIAVLGAGGIATLLAGFVPMVPALILTMLGVSPAWMVWGTASLISVLAVLWLSTWAQAAVVRAAMTDETAMNSMTRAWPQTDSFGWVLTLSVVAIAGGGVLFLIPGLILSVGLFVAPMIVISEDIRGLRALAVSWARVKPFFMATSLRLFVLGLIALLPGRIPYVGWIIAMFWAPFGFIAAARLSKDLKAASPNPSEPGWMGGAVALLSFALIAGTAAAGYAAWRFAKNGWDAVGGVEGLATRVRPETGQALLEAIGRGDEDAEKKATNSILSEIFSSSGTTGGWLR